MNRPAATAGLSGISVCTGKRPVSCLVHHFGAWVDSSCGSFPNLPGHLIPALDALPGLKRGPPSKFRRGRGCSFGPVGIKLVPPDVLLSRSSRSFPERLGAIGCVCPSLRSGALAQLLHRWTAVFHVKRRSRPVIQCCHTYSLCSPKPTDCSGCHGSQ